MITYEFAVDGKSIPFQAADANHAIVRLTATWQKFWRGKVYSGSLYSGGKLIAGVGFPPAQATKDDVRVEWVNGEVKNA